MHDGELTRLVSCLLVAEAEMDGLSASCNLPSQWTWFMDVIMSFLEAEFGSYYGTMLLPSRFPYVRVDLPSEARKEEASRPAEPDRDCRAMLSFLERNWCPSCDIHYGLKMLDSDTPSFVAVRCLSLSPPSLAVIRVPTLSGTLGRCSECSAVPWQ